MSDAKERLARLRARASSRELTNNARAEGGENSTGDGNGASGRAQGEGTSLTAAERLAALREKRKSLSLMSSPRTKSSSGGPSDKKGTSFSKVGGGENDGSDDEGVTSDESDFDDEGKPVLDKASKLDPVGDDDDYDLRGIKFTKGVSHTPSIGFAPIAGSVQNVLEPQVVIPSGRVDALSQRKRRLTASHASAVFKGAAARVIERDDAGDGKASGDGATTDLMSREKEAAALSALAVEEGFYVPEVPKSISRANVARVEDRLLREMESQVVDLQALRDLSQGSQRRSKKGRSSRSLDGSSTASGKSDPSDLQYVDAENRLRISNALIPAPSAEHLFTKGGSLNVEKDPRKNKVLRPVDTDLILGDQDALEYCSTRLVAASTSMSSAANPNGHETAHLDVLVNTVAFDDHPMFIQEDIAACKLRRLFRKYQSRVKENLVDHLTQHIGALIGYEQGLAADGKETFGIQRQIIDMFSRRLSEELQVRELAKETYEQWLELKRVRAEQGFVSTNLKASVMQVEAMLSPEEHAAQLKSVTKIVKQLTPGDGEAPESGAAPAGSQNHLTANEVYKAQDMLKRYEMTRGAFAGRRRSRSGSKRRGSEDFDGGIGVEYAVRVSEEGSYSKDDEVPAAELKRRRAVRREKIAVKVLVNGQSVGKTKSATLTFPGFTASWKRVFRLRLVQRPKSIKLDLRSVGGFLDTTLATVHVPIPASNFSSVLAPSIAPELTWHQFASPKPMRRWLFPKPVDAAKSRTLKDMYADHLQSGSPQLVTESAASDRCASGLLRARLAWSTPDADAMDASDSESEEGSRDCAGSKNEHASTGVADVCLPEAAGQRGESGRYLGKHAAEMSGGDQNGGGGGVSAEAVEFDDMIPDFANEVDFQQLISQMEDLDPNDPRNASVLRLFDLIKWSSKRGVLFRGESLLREALFPTANADRFIESRRTALLRIRKEKPDLFHQPIPLLDDAIKQDENFQTLLLPVEAQMELENEANQALGGRSSSEVLRIQRLQKTRVTDFLNRVRALQSSGMASSHKRDIPLSRILKEGPLPEFSIDTDFFKRMFEPRRKLKPNAKARKAASLGVENASIFVQVVRAMNVPVRRQSALGEEYPASPGRSPMGHAASGGSFKKTGEEGEDDDEDMPGVTTGAERVMSFCQVRFQGASRRSSAQEGPSPTWNESIFIPFIPPRKDFSPSNLQSISEHVWFNIFDEVIVSTQSEDYRTEDQTFQRRERRFLGSFSIPFSTIYMNGRVEGMFRVQTPEVNLGYVQRSKGNTGQPGFGGSGVCSKLANQVQDEAANATYVYLMATLDPVLATAGDSDGSSELEISSGEDPKVMRYGKQWVKGVKNKLKRKSQVNFQAFGTGVNGDSIFIPRFITPQLPPAGKDGNLLGTVPALQRFVSLVPFLDDWQAFADGGTDVWSTSKQFVDEVGCGDHEEHAILLCNYFNWYFRESPAIEAHIVVGRGIPEGDTIYVLLTDSNEQIRLLFNASTGNAYLTSDKFCPLTDVGMVVCDRNMWANIQESGEPAQMRWSFDNPKDWVPFWTSSVPRIDLPSVQAETLPYERVDRRFVSYLETEITDQVQKCMRRWRAKRGTTRFNKIVGRKLRALLERLEDSRLNIRALPSGGEPEATVPAGGEASAHFAALKEVLANNDIVGFPINMTFTEIDAVLKAVRNTGVHETAIDNTTFALGVLVVPYTNKVFSVWVYIAAMTSRRA